MDRVSEPASPRWTKRIQSIDRAATLLTAIAEALEAYTGATVTELAVVRRDGYRGRVGELGEALVG